ncbi:MAG TPA: NAD-dependent epimerase/dehydratase family protein [Roseiflexaceae bacterium]|nr:NAD-dependent epimerase/dehydratase family protein [Roseiflexaceae bacterium]
MRILITGAAGFIGSHLAERLAALGHTVMGLDSLTDYYSSALKQRNAQLLHEQGVSVLPLDLAADDLSSAVEGIEVVYHLAAQPGISAAVSYDTYVRNNLTATYRLIEAARKSESLHAFVNVSTSSVYGADATGDEETAPRPTSYYGVTKLAAEQLALAYQRDKGFPACSFRLFSVYGPRERPDKLYPTLIRALLTDQPFPLFEGAERHLRSYTYVGDIVDGLVASLSAFERCVGEIFNLGTDTAITTAEGIRIVEELVGKPARIARQPRRAGDQSRTHANIAKARRVLGYNPPTTPREGLVQTVAWYRDHL